MISLNHRLKVVSQYLLPNSLADIGSDRLFTYLCITTSSMR